MSMVVFQAQAGVIGLCDTMPFDPLRRSSMSFNPKRAAPAILPRFYVLGRCNSHSFNPSRAPPAFLPVLHRYDIDDGEKFQSLPGPTGHFARLASCLS